jgi:predicted acetyltransferase
MVEIKTVRYSDELDQLVLLIERAFRVKGSREYLTWCHIDNPLAATTPELIVATDGGKIVGARPYMMHELWLGENKVLAAQHCTTMVDPDYRRQGIFNRMGQAAKAYLSENGVPISFGFPGPMSRPGFLKQGYHRLADYEILFRFVSPLDRVRNLVMEKQTGDFTIEISDKYHPAISEIERRRDRRFIDLVRSEAYMRWRLDDNPRLGYRYLIARRDGLPAGFAIISKQKSGFGPAAGVIFDYEVLNRDVGCFLALVSKACQELAHMNCIVVAMLAHDDILIRDALLGTLKFRSTSRPPFSKMRNWGYMEVLEICGRIDHGIDIYNPANWRITYGYPNFT